MATWPTLAWTSSATLTFTPTECHLRDAYTAQKIRWKVGYVCKAIIASVSVWQSVSADTQERFSLLLLTTALLLRLVHGKTELISRLLFNMHALMRPSGHSSRE